MPINKSLLNNIPKSINTSPVIQNASFSLLPVNNQSRSLKQPLGNLNINQLVPEEPKPSTQDDSNFLASLIGQSAAMLGAGIRGGNLSDVAQNFQEMRDRRERQKEQEDLAKKYTDPNSEESKKRRLVYKSALGIDIPENYSYTDLNDPIVLQSIKDKSMEMKYAQMPKQIGTVSTGTKTKEEKPKERKLSQDERALLNNSALAYKALFDMEDAIKKGKSKTSYLGDNEYTYAANRFVEGIGRMQSGGAIGPDEVENFKKLIPGRFDSDELSKQKIKDMKAELESRLKSINFDPKEVLQSRTPSIDFKSEE